MATADADLDRIGHPSSSIAIIERTTALSILPSSAEHLAVPTTNTTYLQWYDQWLCLQFENVPPSISKRVRSFSTAFIEIANSAKSAISIEDIAMSLIRKGLFEAHDTDDEKNLARTFVFAVLGWQTMLYKPAFGTCPPQQLAIADELNGYTGQVFMALKQDQSRIRCCLPDFLLGFGLMLPKQNLCTSEDLEDRHAFDKVAICSPFEFNATLLQSLARINIQWVDVMAPHLEFDKATNTLFLFRYPSFCLANIPSQDDTKAQGVIHACATHDDASSDWASEIDVTQLLHEILLSYRLLFGQDKKSRRLFQSMEAFKGEPSEIQDHLLAHLCGSKTVVLPTLCKEREFYRLGRDFPILRSRIAILQQLIADLKPRGWKEIWKDKRDSAQWYTFWAVIIFGGAGIMLAFIQTVLQAAQLAGVK